MERPPLVGLFVRALAAEIEAIKRGKSGTSVGLTHGHLRATIGGQHIYTFHLESWLSTVDDTPAEIEIEGARYPCYVVSTKGLEVELAVDQGLGEYIPLAVLQTSAWYLLELLRKAFEETDFAKPGSPHLADELFAGATRQTDVPSRSARYTLWPAPPNPSQRSAIDASVGRSLAFVWGPPGTGKTKTIAKAIEAHLNGGRRVLLLSHANAAVDGALADVAEQMRATDLYSEGRLVRFGVCRDEALVREYPLVIPDHIAQVLGRPLVEEQAALKAELQSVTLELARYEEVAAVEARLGAATDVRDAARRALEEKASEVEAARQRTASLQSDLRRAGEERAEAERAGLLRRWFSGLDPTAIGREIERIERELEPEARLEAELRRWSAATREWLRDQDTIVRKLDAELQGVLNRRGLSISGLHAAWNRSRERRKTIEHRLAEIDAELQAIKAGLVTRARLVATTLTQTFAAKEFADAEFDVLVVDESSMAPLPHLYWAASKARSSVTIVGDFAQLAPICVSKDEIAQEWLGRSVYDLLGMASVDVARTDGRICLLDTQYRMAPQIADLPNRLFYGGLLRDGPETPELGGGDPVLGPSSVSLVDIAPGNPWCSRLSTGGRFNPYAALVSASVARRIAETTDWTIGYVSPYRAQARLVDRILEDWGLRGRVTASTVHAFQGGEEDVIVLDCTESPGSGPWSMLDDSRKGSDARRLLNVALTRAKRKLVTVAHAAYLEKALPRASTLVAVLDYCREVGGTMQAQDLVAGYVAASLENSPCLGQYPGLPPQVPSRLHTETDFWPAFISDLADAKESVTLMSPFISLGRAGRLMGLFERLCQRGVQVRCYTRPPWKQPSGMGEHAEEVIRHLQQMGATVVQRPSMHQKVAVVDDMIVWEGSLNILSHKHTHEQMRRLQGANTAREVVRNLHLSEDAGPGDLVDATCPECGSPFVVRKSRFGEFLSCARYPTCKGKAPRHAPKVNPRRISQEPPSQGDVPEAQTAPQAAHPAPQRAARGGTPARKTSRSTGAPSTCPKCGRRLVRRSGPHGSFLGCSGFPSCRYTRNVQGRKRR